MVLQTIAQSIWHLQPFLISGLFSRPLRSIQLGACWTVTCSPAAIAGAPRVQRSEAHSMGLVDQDAER
jgi:hypothetical protein